MSNNLEDSGLVGWKVMVIEAIHPYDLRNKLANWQERFGKTFDELQATSIVSEDGSMTLELRFRKTPILFA